jgi:chromosome segregation ATPase
MDQWKETEVTVKQLDDMMLKIQSLEAQIEVLTAPVNALKQEQFKTELELAETLKALGRESYSSPAGTAAFKQTWQVNMPEDKGPLFELLKEKGIFEKYATIHAGSFKAFYMAEWQIAKDEGRGMEFTLPGCEAPKLKVELSVKPTKKKKV